MSQNLISLKQISDEIIAILPNDEEEFLASVNTLGSVEDYMDWLGARIQKICSLNDIDLLGSDDPYVSDFRKIMENAAVRVGKDRDIPRLAYFGIDVFRHSVKALIN